MPSLVHKRSAQHLTDSSDSGDLLSRASSTPNGKRKRARTKLEHDGFHEEQGEVSDEDQDDRDGVTLVKAEMDGSHLPEDGSGRGEEEVLVEGEGQGEIEPNTQPFQPGSIVRIHAENFVTYTAVEFFPGPNLNMVIGPNGTGKSTIVCAICLGLGSSPANLGRAKEISEFVKHGCDSATIEIELQGRDGERNPIIKRKIGRENNTSSFTLNGSTSTSGKITKLVKSYNIQIDNLCQFLPQDRVVEFAGLTAIDLLTQTQRAAAPPEIIGHHENLKKLGKRQKDLVNELEIDHGQLSQMEARQAALQQDVERLRERQEIIKKIELLEKARPFVKYREAREKAKDAKDASKAAERELRRIEQQVEPMTEAPKKKQKYQKALEKCVTAKKKEVEAKEKAVTKFKDDVISKADDKITDINDKIDAARGAEQDRKQQIAREKEKIAKMKKQLEEEPPEVDLAYYNKKIGESNREIREIRQKIDDIDSEIKPMLERANQITAQISRKNTDLQDLNSVIGVRERMLERISRDTHQVWEWIKSHREMFEQEILGPPVLTCNVTNPKYADAVETQIGRNDKLALVAQNKGDYRKLLDVCFGSGEGSLKLRDVTIRENSNIPTPPLPMSLEEVRELGFDGFTIEFIEGPAPVLSMLCQECRVHMTPISFKEFTAAQNKQMETTRLNRWITGRNLYSLRRRYGQTVTNVVSTRPAQVFAAQPVDRQAEQDIRRSIREMESDLGDIRTKIDELKESRSTFGTQYKTSQAANQSIKAEKTAKQQEATKFVKIKANLAGAEEDLKRKMGGGDEYKENMRKWRERKEKLVMERATDAQRFAGQVKGLVAIHNELIVCQIRLAEAGSDVEILQRRIEDILRNLGTQKSEYQELAEYAKQSASRARELQASCRSIINGLSPAESEFMNEIPPEKTAEDIDTDIEAETARLGLLHEGNPNAIKQFEDRATKIQNLTNRIAEREKNLEKHAAAIAELRGKWEPVIDRLVAKISTAFSKSFEKINCAGEVRVHKEEDDYEKWAIQILVKFRANENLQILTNQRQSGGERAVSTVFYLMALQSLARSPFRVVDEINQGMDPRNERLVHHRMVNIACQEYTSQYFLITPKLLPHLSYHKRMKVHCIFSGDWLQEGTRLDPEKYLKIGARLKAMAH